MTDTETPEQRPPPESSGSVRAEISTEMVGLYKRYAGKGPTRCHTYMHGDLVTIVLADVYTPSEHTLSEAGKWEDVRRARLLWQETMGERFMEVVERNTGRTVAAFMSNNHREPDLAVELFVLDVVDESTSNPD